MINKEKVLLFIKVPPPTTGATLMNTYIRDSKLIHNSFLVDIIPISYMKNRRQMGKINIKKTLIFFSIILKLFIKLTFSKPKLIYFQISPTGLAFYRDLFFISMIKLFRVSILFHIHGKGIKSKLNNNFVKRLYKYAFKKSDIICLSKMLIYDIAEVHKGKIHIVPNGIPQQVSIKVKEVEIRLRPLQIIFLSNLLIDKGLFVFIDTLEILTKKGIEYTAKIIGAEADIEGKELNNIIKAKGLSEHCNYLGPKYFEDKYFELQNADILIFPTKLKHETFGIILLEAMQLSTVVIATGEGAIPEIIDDGRTGYIVDKDSPYQIAEKVTILNSDNNLLINIKENARKKFNECYTLGHFEKNIKTVFEEILNNQN